MEERKSMENLVELIENKFVPLFVKIAQNRYLQAISAGFISTMSATVVGSIFTLICNFPITAWTNWLAKTGLNQILAIPTQATVDLLALYASFFIARSLAKSFDEDGTSAGFISLVNFFIVTGRTDGAYATNYLGAKGVFTAMIVAIVTARLFVFIVKKGWVIKLPDAVPPNITSSFKTLIPAAITITFFLVIAGLMKLTSYGNMHDLIFMTIQNSLMRFAGDSVVTWIFFNLIKNLLWFFGIHGGSIVGAIINPIYAPLSLENLALYNAGQDPVYIISGAFEMCFQCGGAGAMLGLVICMVWFSRSKQYKILGKLALPTAFFNINEPLTFGIPVVLNPIFLLPMLFCTPILATLTYLLMNIGILPIPIGATLPFTTPVFLYGFLQGSWILGVWQIICVVLSGLIWFPFFKIADRRAHDEEINSAIEG